MSVCSLFLSCPVLPCPCPVMSCPVISCPVMPCLVMPCPVLSCPVLSCPVPPLLLSPFRSRSFFSSFGRNIHSLYRRVCRSRIQRARAANVRTARRYPAGNQRGGQGDAPPRRQLHRAPGAATRAPRERNALRARLPVGPHNSSCGDEKLEFRVTFSFFVRMSAAVCSNTRLYLRKKNRTKNVTGARD